MINDFFRRLELDSKRGPGHSAAAGDHGPQTQGIRGHLEKQPDGSLAYKIAFDVHGYRPEDLRTALIGDRTVQVSGRASVAEGQQAGKRTSVSFDEQFTLPDNVDAGQLRSMVSNGQLIVSAPVLPSSAKSPSGRPQAHQQAASLQFQQPQPQPQQGQQHSTLKRLSVYQLEIDLGRGEFSAADLRVSTAEAGSRLVVHGQRQARSAGKTSFREFRDEFDLPAGLDLAKMTARLRSDGRVYVEAPFRSEPDPGGFEYQLLTVVHN